MGNGRSNKIRTPDNFRLRVISLTCPVDVGLSHLRFSSSLSSSYSPTSPHPAHLFAHPFRSVFSLGRTSTDFSFTDAARTLEDAGRSLF